MLDNSIIILPSELKFHKKYDEKSFKILNNNDFSINVS